MKTLLPVPRNSVSFYVTTELFCYLFAYKTTKEAKYGITLTKASAMVYDTRVGVINKPTFMTVILSKSETRNSGT